MAATIAPPSTPLTARSIPHLLEPYLLRPLPDASLLLVTGVLGTTSNWLLQRYLISLLASSSPPSSSSSSPPPPPPPSASTAGRGSGGSRAGYHDGVDDDISGCNRVVLVSFMRDHAFWRDGLGRLGVDLDAAARKGRFVFVDGLTELLSSSSYSSVPPSPSHPGRPAGFSTDSTSTSSAHGQPGRRILTSPTIPALRQVLDDAVADLQRGGGGGKTVLVVDQPDLLLAAAEDTVSSQGLQDLLLDIREKVHATIITAAADEPLVGAVTTALERRHASLVLSLAHGAGLVLSLRPLDTGAAKDVSGVIRITRGGGWDEGGYDDFGGGEERELLYFVGGDGNVRVFERGQ